MESAGQERVLGVYLPSILGNHKENKLLIKKLAIVRLKRCNYGLERLDVLPLRGESSSNDADEDQDNDDDDDEVADQPRMIGEKTPIFNA